VFSLPSLQELLRHSTMRSALDVYTQAITPAKQNAPAAGRFQPIQPAGTKPSIAAMKGNLGLGLKRPFPQLDATSGLSPPRAAPPRALMPEGEISQFARVKVACTAQGRTGAR
jgi:hypothetical protein